MSDKMCPAGCGCRYGGHASDDCGCPWYDAKKSVWCANPRTVGKSTRESEDFADAHWREFVKPKPLVLKAEAGEQDQGANSTELEVASAPPCAPAQPVMPCAKSDPDAFYRWMWGMPRPFTLGLKPVECVQECACCSAIKSLQHLPHTLAAMTRYCPECGGTGLHVGGVR